VDDFTRAVEAEVALRNVNDLIIEVARDRFELLAGHVVCECSQPRCAELLPLTLEDYERIRSDGRRFVLVPGHEHDALETVVAGGDGYVVAEKRGRAGELAVLNDPRRPAYAER
jgi:hypothetical protein